MCKLTSEPCARRRSYWLSRAVGGPGVDRRAIEQTRVCVEIDAMSEHAVDRCTAVETLSTSAYTVDEGTVSIRALFPTSKSRSRSWYWPWVSPHMFSGACSSSSIGCSRKTPRLVRASHRTSSSARCTSVPGRSSLTATSCRMHASSRFRVLSSRRPGVHIRREIVSACSPPSGSCLATACGSAVSVPPGSAMQPLGRAYTYQAVGTVGILRYMLSSLRLQRLCYDPVVTFI